MGDNMDSSGDEQPMLQEEGDPSSPVWKIIWGAAIGLCFEVAYCALVQFTFGKDVSKNAWSALLLFLLARVVVAVFFYCCSDSELLSMCSFAALLCLSFLPFLTYALMADWSLLQECHPVEALHNITTLTAGTVGSIAVVEIECTHAATWLPTSSLPLLQLIIQYGIPLLFGKICLGASKLYGVDLTKSKAKFQLAILDFVDIAGFLTLPFSVTGFVLFDESPSWVKAFFAMAFAAVLAAMFEVTLGLMDGLQKGMVEWFGCECSVLPHDFTFSLVSLLFIDLPFFCTRAYFFWCNIDIETTYLVKNLLCGFLELATCMSCCFSCCGSAKTMAVSVLDILPGTETVTQDAVDQEWKARLSKANTPDNQNSQHAKLIKKKYRSIFRTFPDIMEIIDCEDVTSWSAEEETWWMEKVLEAFRAIDMDNDGAVTSQEIKEAFSLLGRDEDGSAFLDYLNSNGGQCGLDDVARTFLEWRHQEDANLDDDDYCSD
eukprot:TRINITY_DN15711_c0_g1_i2.p1 TRINITY_DN15711_c0_g1~~TRINITY_DN15711_c0_g1_i2.p1  ORF type:complete len:489 (+),score=71.49 TRINITY_DN15711_c0_g1_i2:55-1521(+)